MGLPSLLAVRLVCSSQDAIRQVCLDLNLVVGEGEHFAVGLVNFAEDVEAPVCFKDAKVCPYCKKPLDKDHPEWCESLARL